MTETTGLTTQPTFVVCNVLGALLTNFSSCDNVIDPAQFINNDLQQDTFSKIKSWLLGHPKTQSIEIKIEKFSDGRAFSIAARFRELGYAGELHASGDITQDIIFLLRRVGFTHFHLFLKPTETINPDIFRPFAAHYQAAQDGSLAIWQQNRNQ